MLYMTIIVLKTHFSVHPPTVEVLDMDLKISLTFIHEDPG